jgi:hypothetical protein
MEQTIAGSGTSREPQPDPHRGTPAMSKARSPRAAVIERLGAAMNRAAVLCDHRRRESLGPNARRSADPGPAAWDILCPRTISSPCRWSSARPTRLAVRLKACGGASGVRRFRAWYDAVTVGPVTWPQRVDMTARAAVEECEWRCVKAVDITRRRHGSGESR